MNKGLIKRLVYAGLIGLVSITSAAGEENLISNPGFEKGKEGWSGQWDKECFLDNSQSHNGSSSIKIVCPEGRHHVSVSQIIKQVKPRTNYVLGGWAKAGKSSESRQFKRSSYLVLFYNEENKLIGNSGGGRTQWLPPWIEARHPWTHSSYVFNTPPDTAWIKVCCSLTRAGALWFDDIYLQEVSEGEVYNILPNSSFEVTTNSDTPDYWGRDLNNPPFGEEVWAIDTRTAYHGKKSLRIGVKDKYVRRIYGIKVAQGKDYTFSAYLKSNQEGTKVCLELTGAERSEKKKEVTVTKDWQRYAMTAKMKDTGTVVYVRLLSDAVVWLDALQLEKGKEPSPYRPAEVFTRKIKQASRNPNVKLVEISACRTPKPPLIDGKLDDQCWKESPEMSSFLKITKEEPAREQTKARFCYGDKAFYFAVRAEQSDMKNFRANLAKAQDVWFTDLVEFFIDLNHDRKTFYQLAVNANGQKWHSRITTKDLFAETGHSWNCEWTAKGATDKEGWTVEAAIPYTCFDLRSRIDIGSTIGLNICRTSNPNPFDRKCREYSSWSYSPKGFKRSVSALGEVKGLKLHLVPYRFEIDGLDWFRGIASARIKNDTGRKQAIKVTFCASSTRGDTYQAEAKAASASGEEVEVSAPLSLPKEGLYKVFLRIDDQEGCERYLSQTINIKIPGARVLELVGTEFDFYTKENEARARCFIKADAERGKDLKLFWWLEKDGKRVGKKGTIPGSELSLVVDSSPGINAWTIPIAELANGRYTLKVELEEKGKKIAAAGRGFGKFSPAKHEVRINQWGRFLVFNGRPFFWYGFFCTLSKDDEHTVAILKDMKSVNSTAMLNYVGRSVGIHKEIGKVLDHADKLGLKMWVHLQPMTHYGHPAPHRRFGYTTKEKAMADLDAVVIKHRRHPALLGWCTLDEPGDKFTKEYLEMLYQRIKELDPHHPVIYSHLNVKGYTERFGTTTDFAMIPFVGGGHAEHLFAEYWDLELALATNSPCYSGGINIHDPTPSQQRVKMYKALIMGARGLCTYTYRCTSMHTWREFGRIGKEMQMLSPILLTADDRLRVTARPHNVLAMLKAYKGKYYLIAVNMAEKPVAATFHLIDAEGVQAARPMFGTVKARVDADTKTLFVKMAPQSTAVYEIK